MSTIAEETSSADVAGQLATIAAGLTSARTAAVLAIASLEDPRATAQQADAHAVVARIEIAEEHLALGRERLGSAITGTESEWSEAAAWGRTRGAGSSPSGQPPFAEPSGAGSLGDDGLTEPSRPADPSAMPEGLPESAPRASRDVHESLEYQNRTALALARAGFRVRRLPNTGEGVNPDFEVEGRIFDCYSPNQGTTADSVVTRIRKKSKLQASRFVVNLDRGGLEIDDVRARLAQARPSRIREVFVVRNDAVSRIWP